MSNLSKAERVAQIEGGLKIKDDCFAYKKNSRKCNACNELYCLTEECSFYKTEFERCQECKASRTSITCERCIALGLK